MSARSIEKIARGLALGVALVFVSAQPARADADSDAQDLFVRARDLRQNHRDCAGAVELFRKAHTLAPARLGSLRNIAECEETLSHFASSRRTWLELGRLLLVTKEPGKYDGWGEDARRSAARLLPKIATLKVHIVVRRVEGEGPPTEGPQGDGVTLAANGEVIPAALYETWLERDPGRYIVRAESPRGVAPVEQVVALTAGDSKVITLRLRLTGAREAPSPPVAESATSTRRTVGWVAVGVGAASLVAAGVSLIVRQGALGDLEAACPGYETGPCPTGTMSILSRGSTASTMASIFGIAGGALVVGGAVLVVASPGETAAARAAKPSARREPRVAVAPTLFGAQLTWRFE